MNILNKNYEDAYASSLEIIELRYKVQEGEYVQVEILCLRKSFVGCFIEMMVDDLCFFKGTKVGGIEYLEPDLMKITFMAIPKVINFKEPEESFLHDITINRGELIRIDPVHHSVEYYNPFLKSDFYEPIELFVFKDSIKHETIRAKYDLIKVEIDASWHHSCQGMIDIWPKIESLCPNRTFATLTSLRFLHSLPDMGTSLRSKTYSTGYTVAFKQLKRLNMNKDLTVSLASQKKITLPCYKIKGSYFIEWKASFLRKEKVKIVLRWSEKGFFYPVKDVEGYADIITFTINPSKLKGGHFFDTTNGAIALDQALTLAALKGIQSRFCDCIKIKVPFSIAVKKRVGDSLSYQDKYFGKIARIEGCCNASSAFAILWITLDQAVDMKGQNNLLKRIKLIKEQEADPFSDPQSLQDGDFIKNLTIRYLADAQTEEIQSLLFDNAQSVLKALNDCATEIEIEFLDLRNSKPLTQLYTYDGESHVLAK